MMKKILVTGAAGFIGAALSKKFIKLGYDVLGIDNINDYYDINLKRARLRNIEKVLNGSGTWEFVKCSLEDLKSLEKVFKNFK